MDYSGFSPDEGDAISSFSWRLGAKYYIMGIIPVTFDATGSYGDEVANSAGDTHLWLCFGEGYSW